MGALRERRREARQMCSDLVEIRFQDQTGRWVCQKGLVEDVSARGFCVSLSIPIGVGRTICFSAEGFSGEAQVRYCHLGDYSFLIGAEFTGGRRWDPSKWRPKHLLPLPET